MNEGAGITPQQAVVCAAMPCAGGADAATDAAIAAVQQVVEFLQCAIILCCGNKTRAHSG